MKLKYFFKFYKYIYKALIIYGLWMVFATIFWYLMTLTPIPSIWYLIPSLIAYISGLIYFIKQIIDLIHFMPLHFSDYDRLTYIIDREKEKDQNFKLKKSALYELGNTLCGQEVIEAIAEDNNIEI